MVMAGIMKEKVMGSMEKNRVRLACFIKKKVEKNKYPMTSRKIEITIYATGTQSRI